MSLPLGRRCGWISVKLGNIFHQFKPMFKRTALLIRLRSGAGAVPKGPERSNPQKWAFIFMYVQEQGEDYVRAFHPHSRRSISYILFFSVYHTSAVISRAPSPLAGPTIPRHSSTWQQGALLAVKYVFQYNIFFVLSTLRQGMNIYQGKGNVCC